MNKTGVNREKGRSASDKKEFEVSTASYPKLNEPQQELIKSQRADELKPLYDLINHNRAEKPSGQNYTKAGVLMRRSKSTQHPKVEMGFV